MKFIGLLLPYGLYWYKTGKAQLIINNERYVMSQITEAQLAVRKAKKSELHRARTSLTMQQRNYDAEVAKHQRLGSNERPKHQELMDEKLQHIRETEELIKQLENKEN